MRRCLDPNPPYPLVPRLAALALAHDRASSRAVAAQTPAQIAQDDARAASCARELEAVAREYANTHKGRAALVNLRRCTTHRLCAQVVTAWTRRVMGPIVRDVQAHGASAMAAHMVALAFAAELIKIHDLGGVR